MSKSVKNFLYFLVPWAAILCVFFTYFYVSETEKVKSIRRESELLNVNLGKKAISQEFQTIISDLRILGLNAVFNTKNRTLFPARLHNLKNDFRILSEMKGMYDQVRFLDTEGMEIVRVNYNQGRVTVVPEKLLQNKGDRYYFREAFNQEEGRVYVSPLDLNMEHGKIEEPYKPMIRFGTPVFNIQGEKTGVVLLNYLAEQLLGDFSSAVANIKDHASIVNAEGYWLKNPRPDMEWGFMLNHKHNITNMHPVPWKKINREEDGQFSDSDGMFTFTTIRLSQMLQRHAEAGDTRGAGSLGNEYEWKVVSHVTLDSIAADNKAIMLVLSQIATPIFLLLLLVSWYLAQARVRNKKAEEELQLAATVFETASDGIVVTDAENQIQTVNASFTRITGYDREEVIGKTPAVLNSRRHKKEFYQEMWSSLLTDHQWEGEVWNQRKDGAVYPEWLSIVAVVDDRKTIQHFVALFRDITIKKKNEAILKRQATIDALTGLPNRQLFLDRLSRALLHSKRLKARFALLFIDLDRFKIINDTLGHAAGDQLLQEVSKRIQQVVRESDTVARLGGDEFTVILNNISVNEDAVKVAQLIIDTASEPFVLNGQKASIGASIGIAVFPDDGSEATALMNNADGAMYMAKQAGRNRYCLFGQNCGDEVGIPIGNK